MSTYIMTYPRGFDAPGGGTKSFLQIVYNLQKLGIEIIAIPISTQANGGLSKDLVNALLGTEVSIDDFQVIPAKPSRLHYLLNGRATADVIRSILKDKTIDAVISWEHEAAFAVDFLKGQNIPLAMIAANPSYTLQVELEGKGNPLKKIANHWLRWRSFRQASSVFVSSNFTRQELIDLFRIDPKRIHITHRGIDSIFAQAGDRANSNDSKSNDSRVLQLIFFGSFAPIKGLPDVIDALGLLKQKGYTDWQINIAGWGEKDAIQSAIKQADIESNAVFLGRLAPRELAQSLGQANIAILPSRAESFGRSIAEAQAAGLPVISYDIGSVPEIVEPGETGWLVPPEQPALLAEAIAQALDHPEQSYKMGKRGRQRVIERFSWEKTASSIQQALLTLQPSR